jgi:hypothetical protein
MQRTKGLLVFVVFEVKCVVEALCNSDALARVAFSTIVASESFHVPTSILVPGKWFDPLFNKLGLQVALQELVQLPGIRLEVGAGWWGTRDGHLVKVGEFNGFGWELQGPKSHSTVVCH